MNNENVIEWLQHKYEVNENDDNKGKSPLEDIPRIKLNITTQEIVELIRESRAGI